MEGSVEDWLDKLPCETGSMGVSLASQHVNSTVFPAAVALPVVDALQSMGLVILGGDFWKRQDDGSFKPSYENWFAEEPQKDAGYDKARQAVTEPRRVDMWVSFTCAQAAE
jgi:hypothetical protein